MLSLVFVARAQGASIDSLRDFIRLHQKDYLSDRAYSEADKDKIEVEVGLFVKTCTQQVEALKLSVLAAQRPAAALPPSPP
ncbi:t-SNARE coiled-coil homology domain-containing protein, partial [Haematococcus lacustris]